MKLRTRLPVGVVGKYIGEFHTRARRGHHERNGVAPKRVVRSGFVGGWRFRGAVYFDEGEPRGIIGLLDKIETRDARFADTRSGVFQRGGFKPVDAFRFHLDLDVDHKHEGEN